jgi:hypothetical protein
MSTTLFELTGAAALSAISVLPRSYARDGEVREDLTGSLVSRRQVHDQATARISTETPCVLISSEEEVVEKLALRMRVLDQFHKQPGSNDLQIAEAIGANSFLVSMAIAELQAQGLLEEV